MNLFVVLFDKVTAFLIERTILFVAEVDEPLGRQLYVTMDKSVANTSKFLVIRPDEIIFSKTFGILSELPPLSPNSDEFSFPFPDGLYTVHDA